MNRDREPKARGKNTLPLKTCPICSKEFNWRKKWQRDWQHVVYCSKRCQRNKSRDIVNVQPH
ncbi:DUF2256 domain-containing protein [Thalassotalea eurytherma]|uniref:DUF2256 domain-containing protein n=1 Tax=Thalassotalea eurytherma TaxID=1144278 RepID=UPI0024E18945|nr:DUF2256 domain-containing protein [Thalassotalea eurytherma]